MDSSIDRYEVQLSSQFELDMANVYDWIGNSDRTEQSKSKVLNGIREDILRLETFPNGYRVFGGYNNLGEVRSLVTNGYWVIYQVNDRAKVVTVLRILNARSNVTAILDK